MNSDLALKYTGDTASKSYRWMQKDITVHHKP
jgi:hypothetical protein